MSRRQNPDSSHTWSLSVDLAGSYFEGLRALIGDSPRRYVQQYVVLCGEWPYSVDALSRLLPPLCRWHEQESVPNGTLAHTVIVGQWNASQEVMSRLLDEAEKRHAVPPRFIPQEGFVDEILFGHDWWADSRNLLNGTLAYHQGLQIAHHLHLGEGAFAWPNVEADEAIHGSDSESEVFSPETALHALGYQITGLTRAERWRVLTRSAVPELGLKVVAQTIASHVRLRKTQRNGRQKFRHAIAEWEHDLARLKTEYWARLAYRFPWPEVEPD